MGDKLVNLKLVRETYTLACVNWWMVPFLALYYLLPIIAATLVMIFFSPFYHLVPRGAPMRWILISTASLLAVLAYAITFSFTIQRYYWRLLKLVDLEPKAFRAFKKAHSWKYFLLKICYYALLLLPAVLIQVLFFLALGMKDLGVSQEEAYVAYAGLYLLAMVLSALFSFALMFVVKFLLLFHTAVFYQLTTHPLKAIRKAYHLFFLRKKESSILFLITIGCYILFYAIVAVISLLVNPLMQSASEGIAIFFSLILSLLYIAGALFVSYYTTLLLFYYVSILKKTKKVNVTNRK